MIEKIKRELGVGEEEGRKQAIIKKVETYERKNKRLCPK